MYPFYLFSMLPRPVPALSSRQIRQRDLEARMSAFLSAKQHDASGDLIDGITAQRDRLRGTRYNKTR
ncbi:hypothetical protein [Roseibium sp.]|uniref:hypothetical protein n=1 Tax=Roseibium sp. TaxID=1936156 RepID=UPI003A970A65